MIRNEEELLQNKVFRELTTLPLLQNEYVIMSSGIMFALGIRDLATLDDIDIMVNVVGWEKTKNMSQIIHDSEWNCDHIYLFNNEIEVCNGWGPSVYNFEDLLKSAYKVGRFNFMSLNDVVEWKKELGREKDLTHIKMIEQFLLENPNFQMNDKS